jgi:hypothetical protein
MRVEEAKALGRLAGHAAIRPDKGLHLGGLTHFHLLGHPRVYEQIRLWIERTAAAPA